jgi:hypothetical protein
MNILMVFSASGGIAPSHIKINPLAEKNICQWIMNF